MTARLFALACLSLFSVAAAADVLRTGTFITSFIQATPLAAPREVAKRLGMTDPGPVPGITPSAENWHVYVPEDYDGTKSYGVMVWISPSDSGELPGGWRHVLKDHQLIYVAADKSGNAQDVATRRVPLALTGLANVEMEYKIDPARIYVGGFSGGGITASHISAGYADAFTGGLFVSTSHGIGSADMSAPAPERLYAMQTRGRYVFTAGSEETDNQIMTTRAVDEFRALCVLRVDYIRIPNAGHADLDSRSLQRALKYLDSPSVTSASDQSDCKRALGMRRAAAIAAVRDTIRAGDKPKARELLEALHRDFGPLAEPDYSALSACLYGTTAQACASGGG